MPLPKIIFTVILLLMGGLFSIIPGLTRADLFFAVTVTPDFSANSRCPADTAAILDDRLDLYGGRDCGGAGHWTHIDFAADSGGGIS